MPFKKTGRAPVSGESFDLPVQPEAQPKPLTDAEIKQREADRARTNDPHYGYPRGPFSLGLAADRVHNVFRKIATAQVLGSWSGDDKTSLVRTASRLDSVFLQQAGQIDVEAMLRDVAAEYNISANPRDYLFVPVRANSVDVPNENGDAFSRKESLRFDHRLGKRVYQTYLCKPHHVNHRADNPKMARGLIVDVRFNDQNPMPPEWRQKYAKAVGHDVPVDQFTETLLGVDRSKDPHLAEGIRTKVINAFSMGCECESTTCNVCGNRAASKREFCTHIKTGKLKFFPRPSDGHVVQAFEWCEGVVYGELSAVDQPADPRAFGGEEVFQLHASLEDLSPRERLEILAFARTAGHLCPEAVQKLLARAL